MKIAWLAGATLGLILLPAAAGAEERWLLNGAGSFAGPISSPYTADFASGAVGDLGAYRSLTPNLLLGARVSAGVLSHDDTVEGTIADQGDYGLGMLSAAVRFRPLGKRGDPQRGTGLWLEAAGGPGIAEGDVRPMISPGLGYVFDLGGFGVGPLGRYVHVFESDTRFGGEDAQMLTAGLELMFLDARKPRAGELEEPKGREFVPPPPPSPPLQPAARVEPATDSDRDGLIDANDKCPNQPETMNGINDHDGCPDKELAFIDDRLVLDERVLFPYDSFTLEAAGEERLKTIADLYKRTGGEWKKLEIKGYADARGSQDYNYDLSRRRAKAVKRYLTSLDVPDEVLDIEAYGELDPAVPAAETEAEHRQNRRVEFVIIRE
jgi:outer membrane protein OmpA-like peptidoglycan-associated protein